jgi:hypothetical protein
MNQSSRDKPKLRTIRFDRIAVTAIPLRRTIAMRFRIGVIYCALVLCSCAQRMTLYSADGESWEGKWRHAGHETGLIQISGAMGEILVGTFKPVSREVFFEKYQKVFGSGAIAAYGPDLSAFGNAFAGVFGASNTLLDVAYGESFNPTAQKSIQMVAGPLFYWTANLEGDRKTTMHCFLIGSAYTGHGLGRCKETTGKDYTVEF